MVVVVGLTVADPFHVGDESAGVNVVAGENVALAPLVYHALSVTGCPASIFEGVAVKVQVAPPVGTVHAMPEQSVLHFPGCPFCAPSSQTSFGSTDRACQSIVSPSTSIPSVSSSSIIPSPHLAI